MTKMHATALDTFQSARTAARSGAVADGARRRRPGARAAAARARPTRAPSRVHLITADVGTDGALLDAAVAAGADGIVVAATGAGQHRAGAARRGRAGDGGGIPVVLASRCPAGAVATAYAFPGGGATWVRAGALPVGHAVRDQGPSRAGARARAPDSIATGSRRCWPTRYGLTGHAARHARSPGGSRRSPATPASAGSRRSASATGGSRSPARRSISRRGPTRSPSGSQLEPDEVAIPGLTDAHLHLARRAIAARQVDLTDAPTLDDGPRADRARRTSGCPSRMPGSRAMAGTPTAGVAGRPPTTSSASRRAGGLRSGRTTTTRCGPATPRSRDGGARPRRRRSRRRRDPADGDGEPEGVLLEAATRLVDGPRPADRRRRARAALIAVGRELAVARASSAVHDPGGARPGPGPRASRSRPTRACPTAAGCRSASTPAMRDDAPRRRRSQRGLRSGAAPRRRPGRAGHGRLAEVLRRWLARLADRGAARADIEPEADRPLPPERRRGVWITDPDALARAWPSGRPPAGIATQIHAIGDAAVRAALDVARRRPRPTSPLMPRIEHVQLLHPADRPGSRRPGSRPASSRSHLGTDAAHGAQAVGRPRRGATATPGSRSPTPGRSCAFGTDAPVEPFDPWPGHRARRPPRGSALAGGHAAVRAGASR